MRKKVLLYFGCALIAGGALALGWFGDLEWNMRREQRAAQRMLDTENQTSTQRAESKAAPHAALIPRPQNGELIGKIEIPRLHVSVMVLEGTAPGILRIAAGHINGTALPGSTGNIGIVAHRDTFFRPLREIGPQDLIVVTTSNGTFQYVVDGLEIVDPHHVEVLDQRTVPELTLVTCYPFTFVGPAPKRLIVHAHQRRPET
jgi:sortase A